MNADSHDEERPGPSTKRLRTRAHHRQNEDKIASKLMDYITGEYELLKNVLSNLCIRDLQASAVVCRAWNHAANIIKSSRHEPDWFLWSDKDSTHDIEKYPKKVFADGVFCDPEVCLCFMTNKAFTRKISCMKSETPCPFRRSGECRDMHQVPNYLRAEIPAHCSCLIMESSGIIGTKKLEPTQQIRSGRWGYSTLLLPRIPGVDISTFTLEEPDDLRFLLRRCRPLFSPTPSCILLFCSETFELLPIIFHARERPAVVIPTGGGIFTSGHTIQKDSYGRQQMVASPVVGMVFTGQNVKASSAVLSRRVKEPEDIAIAIQKIKQHEPRGTERSIGFMFSCVGRTPSRYTRDNIESEIFRMYFPSTPLFGFFGNGEIGINSLPDETGEVQYTRDWYHTYSTVFVVVYFGKFDD